MSAKQSSPDRRAVLASSAALAAARLVPTQADAAPAGDAVRPFNIDVPDAELSELRRRIAATRWPERETVTDDSQGVPLAMMQELASYWAKDYDWRKCEATLNALPQFMTEIDGLDIHFIHVRSKHENALPMIVTHGWPGSVIEQLKIIDPLTNPMAHGASASDAFHLVIPSIPGYGFSGKPTATGWGPPRIARAWVVLDEAPWLRAIRFAGRRLGRSDHKCDGRTSTSGIIGYSRQFPRNDPSRYCQAAAMRRSGAGRSAAAKPVSAAHNSRPITILIAS
jgi:hypothetical protein